MKEISLAVIGLGNRAGKYLGCLDADTRVKCLVEPDSFRLRRAASRYGVPKAMCFSSLEEFIASGTEVDGVIIAGPDRMHFSAAMESVRRGFHVLVEKPAVVSENDYRALMDEAAKRNVTVGVCLVMRYHPYYKRIKELVDGGAVGQILRIKHTEHIGPDRMGHTFVRGDWSRKDHSGPIFLSKCCHDVDFIIGLTGSKAAEVRSSGERRLFRQEMAPSGSTSRCIDCPVNGCPYSAVNLYRERKEWIAGFDIPEGKTFDDVVSDVLLQSRFGRCVYRCDNDVYDTQKVEVVLENGIHIDLTLDGTSLEEGRETVIEGSKGELRAKGGIISYSGLSEDFSSLESVPLHAGADKLLIQDFLESIRNGSPMVSSLADAAEAHRICFLAG